MVGCFIVNFLYHFYGSQSFFLFRVLCLTVNFLTLFNQDTQIMSRLVVAAFTQGDYDTSIKRFNCVSFKIMGWYHPCLFTVLLDMTPHITKMTYYGFGILDIYTYHRSIEYMFILITYMAFATTYIMICNLIH